jgi:hypothetical protein
MFRHILHKPLIGFVIAAVSPISQGSAVLICSRPLGAFRYRFLLDSANPVLPTLGAWKTYTRRVTWGSLCGE